ncbi:N-acetyl-gamma-glutamyl-phosphate reductase [Sulfidibacter corallicola]|uniref:N-acetyl-gamma-glutamyl-phosphate reductase n=1 Tax=Sulfidibacter corallicola TaxID=2818388 RepID=A0A8A4TPB9_SULCO|nr:N-acetyl-gamma-glutamyl-phosphate reductase [Sulfidibacter corallicola]QTD51390.1 N-acetyl-gamma-glutamyl-phosphate reductase [Sulfidibacter corallicola]
MSREVRVAIAGGSGYTGGELLRLLLFHPHVQVQQITSERFAGKPVTKVHPNLRKLTPLKFDKIGDLQPCDLLFLCLPHGETANRWDDFVRLAPKVIDLSADFRLNDAAAYRHAYKKHHPRPDLLQRFVYGIPELHRDEIRDADYVASAGCNATATILGLYPLYRAGVVDPERTVVEVKVGSSEAGNRANEGSHHPERSNCLRSFSPTGHRHVAEITQELSFGSKIQVHFSATAVDMVRGALATSHVFLNQGLEEKDVWKIYREHYAAEPFVRIVKERDGIYRYPEPKLLAGTNFCDVGFERDPASDRVVVISAIDNLMKGSAGQAVQALNLMCGFEERTALEFPGLHPV